MHGAFVFTVYRGSKGKVNKSYRARKVKNHNEKAPKQTNAVDKTIGERIRARRLELRLSQAYLGRELGISFQQLQKYEKGTNRVSSARLSEMAQVLKIETGYFLGELNHRETVPSQYQAFLATRDGADIFGVMIELPVDLRRYIIDSARRPLQLTRTRSSSANRAQDRGST